PPDAQRLAERQRPTCQQGIERAARHEAHHDIKLALKLAKVVDRQDMRVLQLGDGAGFALEQFDRVAVSVEVTRNGFDRYSAVETFVARRPDIGHAAAPDMFHYCVMPNPVPGFQHVITPLCDPLSSL